MTARIAVAAIGALFALLVLAGVLVGLWLYVWGMREPMQFQEWVEGQKEKEE